MKPGRESAKFKREREAHHELAFHHFDQEVAMKQGMDFKKRQKWQGEMAQ